jgi:small subunit ribosomal protein S5
MLTTLPHCLRRIEVRHHSALVVLRPASEGTGCIAGSSVRTVLELAGVQNVLAKRIGSRNLLNNARATVKALESLRTLEDVASARGLPIEYLRS